MGQYYKPIILAPREERKGEKIIAFFYSHRYGNGLKLMEHSYVGNHFVNAVMNYLLDNPQRLVWAGDYADKEPHTKNTNLYDRTRDKKYKGAEVVDGNGADIKGRVYVINHTAREFYCQNEIRPNVTWRGEPCGKINPLPLLTCEGNGRGGGDYYGPDPGNHVGSWARDVIEVSHKRPKGYEFLDANDFGFSESD